MSGVEREKKVACPLVSSGGVKGIIRDSDLAPSQRSAILEAISRLPELGSQELAHKVAERLELAFYRLGIPLSRLAPEEREEISDALNDLFPGIGKELNKVIFGKCSA